MSFFSSLAPLEQRSAFRRHLFRLRHKEWVVYAKAPFAGPEQVLNYVGCYTHRVAISNHRLLNIDNGEVRFHWKDYRDSNRRKTMTLSAHEFIRRFLLHVLPDGFQRIRYYGFLANRYRQQKLRRCRELLAMAPAPQASSSSESGKDYRDRYEELTGISLRQCPVCAQGRMVLVEFLAPLGRVPIAGDTS